MTTILLIAFLAERYHKSQTKKKSERIIKKQVSFNIDNYYFPKEPIKFKEIEVLSILFSTKDEVDESNRNVINKVCLNILNIQSDKEIELVAETFQIINRTIIFSVNIPDNGVFNFTGTFLGENGPMNYSVSENETVEMKCLIEINGIYKKETDFTYFSGE
jgi:hypothetical protein